MTNFSPLIWLVSVQIIFAFVRVFEISGEKKDFNFLFGICLKLFTRRFNISSKYPKQTWWWIIVCPKPSSAIFQFACNKGLWSKSVHNKPRSLSHSRNTDNNPLVSAITCRPHWDPHTVINTVIADLSDNHFHTLNFWHNSVHTVNRLNWNSWRRSMLEERNFSQINL